jgi:hypothetical protein
VTEFVKCCFCAGHEAISAEAAAHIADELAYLEYRLSEGPLLTELMNIRNAILNTQERTSEPEYVPPICPTPDKRKYSNRDHASHDAKRWNQHPYTCECGYVHLSKQTEAEHAAKIDQAPASIDEFDEVDPLLR